MSTKVIKPKCAICTNPCPCGAVHCNSQGEYVCWGHLDQETKDRYPGSDRLHELEVARIERSRSQAVKNFGLDAAA